MRVGACPSTEQLARLARGELSTIDIDVLEPHVLGCDHCASLLRPLVSDTDMLARAMSAEETVASEPVVKQLMEWLQQSRSGDRIRFTCRACAKTLACKAEFAGRRITCPGCGEPVLVPRPETTFFDARTLLSQKGDEPTPVNEMDGTVDFDQSDQEAFADAELTEFLAPPQRPDEIGRLGEFRVLKLLGRGGMGVVFQAEDPGLERLVALKAMLPALATNRTARIRFLREAKAAASVHHPHIVTIHRVEERPTPFLAMEFLEGETLDARLRRERVLPIDEIARIGREIAEGLAAAHDRGLVHRDVKPGNIWLAGAASSVKILDFGLARPLADQTHITHDGAIVGTPAYMSPEQACGKAVDHRSDLYSLGVILYRMATGEMPIKGDTTLAILSALANATPLAPAKLDPRVPRALSDLVMQLLAKEPAHRVQSAREVIVRLADAKTLTATRSRPSRMRRTFVAAAALIVLIGVGLTFAPPWKNDDLTPSPTIAKDSSSTSPAIAPPAVRHRYGLIFGPKSKVMSLVATRFPHEACTYEAWLTVTSMTGNIARGPNSNLGFDVARPQFYTFHASAKSGEPFAPDRRTHVAGVNKGKLRRLFVDGKLVTQISAPSDLHYGDKDVPITLGGDEFEGMLEAVRISTNARYDRDFSPPEVFDADADTLALYRFDEGQGDLLKDSSDSGLDGKIDGAQWVKLTDSSTSTPAPSTNAPAAKPVDLLSLVDVERDTLEGKWRRDPSGGIASVPEKNENMALRLPVDPGPEYRIRVGFATVRGNFDLVLPIDGKEAVLFITGGRLGLSFDLDQRLGTTREMPFVMYSGKRHLLDVHVTRPTPMHFRVRASVDDVPAFDWQGPCSRLKSRDWMKMSENCLAVRVFHVVTQPVQLSEAELTVLSGAMKRLRP